MAKTITVICKIKYYDMEMERLVSKNEKIKVKEKRAKVLIDKKYCELVSIK